MDLNLIGMESKVSLATLSLTFILAGPKGRCSIESNLHEMIHRIQSDIYKQIAVFLLLFFFFLIFVLLCFVLFLNDYDNRCEKSPRSATTSRRNARQLRTTYTWRTNSGFVQFVVTALHLRIEHARTRTYTHTHTHTHTHTSNLDK